MKIFFWILAGCIGAYSLLLCWLYVAQRKLLYFPTHRDLEAVGIGNFEPWKAADGHFLGYVRASESSKQVLIFFHGNAGEAIDRFWFERLVTPASLVVLAEYPGFGACPGKATQQSIHAAALKIFDEAKDKWNLPIGLVSESLGTGVASYVASRRDASKVGLINPFNSAAAVAKYRFPFFPAGRLLKDKFPADEYLREVKIPLYIIQGMQDDVIPIELGQELYNGYAGDEKQITQIPGFGHGDIVPALIDSPLAESFRNFLDN